MMKFKKLHPHAIVPKQATPGAAAYDLHARLERPTLLYPGKRLLVKTGIAISPPAGFAAMVLPRSGLAIKHGITVLNSPGLIDPDYRGEIGVELYNAADTEEYRAFKIDPDMRVAQLLLIPLVSMAWQEVEDLDETERGEGGFGSTGLTSEEAFGLRAETISDPHLVINGAPDNLETGLWPTGSPYFARQDEGVGQLHVEGRVHAVPAVHYGLPADAKTVPPIIGSGPDTGLYAPLQDHVTHADHFTIGDRPAE